MIGSTLLLKWPLFWYKDITPSSDSNIWFSGFTLKFSFFFFEIYLFIRAGRMFRKGLMKHKREIFTRIWSQVRYLWFSWSVGLSKSLHKKCSYFEFFGRYFSTFGLNREIYFANSVFSLNTGKYGPEKLQTRTLFTRWMPLVHQIYEVCFLKRLKCSINRVLLSNLFAITLSQSFVEQKRYFY